ncbi:MAG: YlxR family protein [Bacilli bacterium]
MKKEIMRTCIVSHEIKDRNFLFRVVLTPSNEVVLDKTYKANGRGAYISKDKDLILKGKKNKVLNRALKTDVSEDIYDLLLENL